MRVTNYAKANGMSAELEALMAETKGNAQAEDVPEVAHRLADAGAPQL